jgi:hypothetical protein
MKSTVLGLSVINSNQSFEIILSGSSEKIVLLKHELHPNFRPYIHPIRPLDGSFMITENSPAHHPWQHGLYFGLHGVNGSDFWLDRGEKVGSFKNTKLESQETKSDVVNWIVSTNWVHHDGTILFKETQTWSLVLKENYFYLDVQFKLLALQQITIDQCKYGGLFLRMPWRNDVNSQAINSNGETNKDAEQKMAKWVDITMQWPEHAKSYGFSIFENPKNIGFPNYWRIDGNFGVGPSNVIKGPNHLSKGEEFLLAYRLVVHEGVLEKIAIEKLYHFFERENNV